LADSEKQDFRKFGPKPHGHWQQSYLLNPQGKIVYFSFQDTTGHKIPELAIAMKRVLDSKLDKEWQAGFPTKTKALPKKKPGAKGTSYLDDFESYQDTEDFLLQPRWGKVELGALTYRGKIIPAHGTKGSKALSVETGRRGRKPYGIQHQLPKPLTNGYIRFSVKRGKAGWNKKKPQTLFFLDFFTNDGKIGDITIKGTWTKESFEINGETSKAKLSTDDWQEVSVKVTAGKPAMVTVDGKQVGQLLPGPVLRIAFGCGHHGFMLDDLEVFYQK